MKKYVCDACGWIYDEAVGDEENGIPAQIKRYVSGGNDAGHIHKSADGTRCLAISAPTRYLHSASCVISIKDFESIKSHVYAILTSYQF